MTEMMSNQAHTPETALILCPENSAGNQMLLGLTICERLLHVLERAGVRRAVCIGAGSIPRSKRARIEVAKGDWAVIDSHSDLLLVPADAVLSPNLLKQGPEVLVDYPVRIISSDKFDEVKADPETWLKDLSLGQTGKPLFGIRVLDKKSRKQAEKAMLSSLRKEIDGIVSKYVNRNISIFLSKYLVRTGISPNSLTAIFTVVGIAAALVAFSAETWLGFAVAGFLFQAQSILDGCDGEVARLTYRFSKAGQWLDTIGDDITNYLFCLALAFNQAGAHHWNRLYILGIVTLVFQCAITVILYRRLIQWGTGDLLAVPDTLTKGQIKGLMGKFLAFLAIIRKRDFFVFVVALATASNLPILGFFLIAVGTYASFVGILINDLRISKMQKQGNLVR